MILAVRNNGKNFSGYVGGKDPIWVIGGCEDGNFRSALKSVPDDQVSKLANVTWQEQVSFEKGEFAFGLTKPIALPDDWLLLGEWLGGNPQESPDTLKHIGPEGAWTNIGVVKSLEKSGFLKYRRLHVKESDGKLRHVVTDEGGKPAGFALQLADGFLILHQRDATDKQMAEIEKLAKTIAVQ